MHPLFMLLKYRDLPGGLDRAPNNWLKASRTYESTFNLYFSALHPPGMFAEQRYLSMVQAAEAYHKQKYGKRTDLKQRIQQLTCRFGESLRPLVGDPLGFAVRVYNTRNYYAHYDSRNREKSASGYELHLLTQHMSYLVRACLLAELGFDDSAIGNLFRNSRQFKFVADETAAFAGRQGGTDGRD